MFGFRINLQPKNGHEHSQNLFFHRLQIAASSAIKYARQIIYIAIKMS